VLTNNLILRAGPARAAHARDDTATAIQMYRQLLENGPDLRSVSLCEPRYVLQVPQCSTRLEIDEYCHTQIVWRAAEMTLFHERAPAEHNAKL
jgi:hypothetical protein